VSVNYVMKLELCANVVHDDCNFDVKSQLDC